MYIYIYFCIILDVPFDFIANYAKKCISKIDR